MGRVRARSIFVFVIAVIVAAMVAPVAVAQDTGKKAGEPAGAASILSVVDAGKSSINARGDRLTLDDVKSRAVWFTDRPSRNAGRFAIPDLIRVFFDHQVPPNAAIEFVGASEKNDVAIVELSKPHYDKKASRLTFAVRLVPDPSAALSTDTALDAFVARNDGKLQKSFGATSVFIDSATNAGLNADPATDFTLKVVNHSNETWTFYTYVRAQNGDPQLVSLAWFSHSIAPGEDLQFEWGDDFSLMWARSGSLAPGVVFSPDQRFPADPSANQPARAGQPGRWAGLTFDAADGLFSFVDGEAVLDPPANSLFIQSDATVPNGVASVGIGLAGSPVFARPALTNVSANFPTTGLSFYVAAAIGMQAGQALDPVVQNATEIPTGSPAVTATFNPDHTWTISSS